MNVDTSSENRQVEPVKEAPEEGADILKECFGGCKKKILVFSLPSTEDWGENTEGALCLECKARLLASGSLKK